MKDILLIGGPKTVPGVERIDDDLLSILSVDGLYDRKAVVVWPSAGFLNFPIAPDRLKPFWVARGHAQFCLFTHVACGLRRLRLLRKRVACF